MRFRNRPMPVLEATACDEHLPTAMRVVAPKNGDNTDTHVLVHRLDQPEEGRWCDTCTKNADWHLTTLEVIR